eukprot:m.174352 g.174352  ORF g.174352 m.174352 type:complete len:70 (+) comp39111_c1_seq1:4833-5042(+)
MHKWFISIKTQIKCTTMTPPNKKNGVFRIVQCTSTQTLIPLRNTGTFRDVKCQKRRGQKRLKNADNFMK